MNYQNKYLKYKSKYLFINNINNHIKNKYNGGW